MSLSLVFPLVTVCLCVWGQTFQGALALQPLPSMTHKALSFPTPPGRGRQPLLPYPCHGGWLGGGWGLWGWSLGSPFINQGEQPKAVTQGIWSQALGQACMPCLPLLATSTTTAPG